LGEVVDEALKAGWIAEGKTAGGADAVDDGGVVAVEVGGDALERPGVAIAKDEPDGPADVTKEGGAFPGTDEGDGEAGDGAGAGEEISGGVGGVVEGGGHQMRRWASWSR